MAAVHMPPRPLRAGPARRGIDRWSRAAAVLVAAVQAGLLGAYGCLIAMVCSAALGGPR
jgi:hypothetical protein